MGQFGENYGANYDVGASVGSGSGGQVKKSTGYQLTDLGPRPHVISAGESVWQLVITPINRSKSRLVTDLKGESFSRIKPLISIGVSISQITIPVTNESRASILFKENNESYGLVHSTFVLEKTLKNIGESNEKSVEDLKQEVARMRKILKASLYLNMMESINSIYRENN